MSQSQLAVNTWSWGEARENAGVQAKSAWLWFYFWLDEKVARVFKPIMLRSWYNTRTPSLLDTNQEITLVVVCGSTTAYVG